MNQTGRKREDKKAVGDNLTATSYSINQNLNYEKIYVFLFANMHQCF